MVDCAGRSDTDSTGSSSSPGKRAASGSPDSSKKKKGSKKHGKHHHGDKDGKHMKRSKTMHLKGED